MDEEGKGLFGLMNVCVINLHMEFPSCFTFRALKNHASYLSTTTTMKKAFLISDSNSMMRLLLCICCCCCEDDVVAVV